MAARRAVWAGIGVSVAAWALTACSGSTRSSGAGTTGASVAAPPTTGPPSTSVASTSVAPGPTTTAVAVSATPDDAGVVWLCRPGAPADPCMTDQSSTTVTAATELSVVHAPPPTADKSVDCFYVYPTVSPQTTANADLTIEPAEVKVAEAQASRFSAVCNVWAPMYRQQPTNGPQLSAPDEAAAGQVAYDSVDAAWHDYLDHDNGGKPVVVLGHSQGSAILINLLEREVDGDAAMRSKLVSAIILGGNVQVPVGADVGATFQHIPACRAAEQTGCVIAYSSFPGQPPADAVFGIAGQGIDARTGQATSGPTQVLCTNPASLGDPTATAGLNPYFWIADRPSRRVLSTDWVQFPLLYTAECHQGDGASWLQVNDIGTASDTRTRLTLTNGPAWGYHAADVNVALGDLVGDVDAEITAYLAHGGGR